VPLQIVIVIEEAEKYEDIIGSRQPPYINELAARGSEALR
jgi:hypothetical protein